MCLTILTFLNSKFIFHNLDFFLLFRIFNSAVLTYFHAIASLHLSVMTPPPPRLKIYLHLAILNIFLIITSLYSVNSDFSSQNSVFVLNFAILNLFLVILSLYITILFSLDEELISCNYNFLNSDFISHNFDFFLEILNLHHIINFFEFFEILQLNVFLIIFVCISCNLDFLGILILYLTILTFS